jgi:MtN3 and saliva related transmembrane protein
MDVATAVGYLASICSMTSFAPQAWKIIKTRDTSAISAGMYSVTVAGFALWTAFGVFRMEWPIIITNTVCFCFSVFILAMTLLPRRKRDEVADRLSGQK